MCLHFNGLCLCVYTHTHARTNVGVFMFICEQNIIDYWSIKAVWQEWKYFQTQGISVSLHSFYGSCQNFTAHWPKSSYFFAFVIPSFTHWVSYHEPFIMSGASEFHNRSEVKQSPTRGQHALGCSRHWRDEFCTWFLLQTVLEFSVWWGTNSLATHKNRDVIFLLAQHRIYFSKRTVWPDVSFKNVPMY